MVKIKVVGNKVTVTGIPAGKTVEIEAWLDGGGAGETIDCTGQEKVELSYNTIITHVEVNKYSEEGQETIAVWP